MENATSNPMRDPSSESIVVSVPDEVTPLEVGRAQPTTRILVADDHEIGQELVGMMAARLGVEVERARDGYEALCLVEQAKRDGRPFSLVLMDFFMPIVDGTEATRRLRNAGHSAQELPIIALTACAEPEEVKRFRAAGGQAHVAKPVRIEDLAAIFKAWVPREAGPSIPEKANKHLELKQRFRERKTETIARIHGAIAQQDTSSETVKELTELLHNLAGTAGFFGEEAVSVAAAEFETALLGATPVHILDVLERYLARLVQVS